MMETGRTTYSEKVPGQKGNYGWPVVFDITDGFVGISQYDENGNVKDRVLLSPKQVRELTAFVNQ